MKSALQKFLFPAVILNTTALAMAQEGNIETFGSSINRAMNKYFTAEVIASILVVLMLAIAGAIYFEIRRSNKIKRELAELAMARFDLQAEKLNLRLTNVTILKAIAGKCELQDPSSILKFPQVFESAIEKYYQSVKIESIPNDTLVKISALRKTLGYMPLPKGVELTSTRQFSSGDECMIQFPEIDSQTYNGMCLVLDSGERQWSITRPEVPHISGGTWVQMSVARQGDAEYAFKTQVLKDSQEKLVLSHTNELTRTQQRNWMRVNVNVPVMATLMEETNTNAILSGRIIDISGGGLCITLPAELPKDSMILVTFKLPGYGQITDLLGRVVRVAGAFDGDPSRIVHSVAFAGEIDLLHEKIIQYVFEKQRESLSGK